MRPFFLILPALLATAPAEAVEAEPRPEPGPRRPRRDDRDPHDVDCPRCHAPKGRPCDRRTLGGKSYHYARVVAAGCRP